MPIPESSRVEEDDSKDVKDTDEEEEKKRMPVL